MISVDRPGIHDTVKGIVAFIRTPHVNQTRPN